MVQGSNTLDLQVPKGHVWLEGDNPLNSTDSRQYGPVPWALLQGRAFLKVSIGAASAAIAIHDLAGGGLRLDICLQVWPLTEAGMVERKLMQR